MLQSLPEVTEAAAFGVPDAFGVTQIWAAIVASATVPQARLHALCRDQLGDKAPKFIVQVARLPRNANGKILRDRLSADAASYFHARGLTSAGPTG